MVEPQPAASANNTVSDDEIEDVQRLAYREARRRFVSRESAEDMAQVTAARFLARRSFIQAIPAWVRAVVQHLVYRRNAARARRMIVETILEEPSVEPLDVLEKQHLLAAIKARLPERDRTLLEQALAGHRHEEIGRAFGLQTSAVGAHLARVTERAGRIRATLVPPSPKKSSPRR